MIHNSKLMLFIVALMVILLISIGLLEYDRSQPDPNWVAPSDSIQHTDIILLTLNFNDTILETEDLETSIFLPAFEFIKGSSDGKMTVEIVETKFYTALHNEKYYGEDIGDQGDIRLTELYDEVFQFWQQEKLLLVLHPGISQTLNIGNSTGIHDQYFGSQIGYDDGTIFLSAYSPFAVLVHELGHFWGLPDLYLKNQVGFYGMMGAGLWHSFNETTQTHGNDGTDPIDFCSWSKLQLGWKGYWNASYVKKSSFNTSNIIRVENILIQFVDILYEGSGVVILSDKIRDAEFLKLLQSGSVQVKLRSGQLIQISFDNNEISIVYLTIRNITFTFDEALQWGFRTFVIIMIILSLRAFGVMSRK